MVSTEGVESALRQQRKNLVEHSWQSKALQVYDSNKPVSEITLVVNRPRQASSRDCGDLLLFKVAEALRGVVQGVRLNTTTLRTPHPVRSLIEIGMSKFAIAAH